MDAPKPRKLTSRVHKHFSDHSRILDQETVDIAQPFNRKKLRPGDKQTDPNTYGRRRTGGYGDYRTRAELRNDAQRNHEQ